MSQDLHATCPYRTLPARSSWRRTMAEEAGHAFDPGVERPFRIAKTDAIATAGSCFAQNIARYLADSGYRYLVTEPAPRGIAVDLLQGYNYGTFTARYANIYTARQLRQTAERAYGSFQPRDGAWAMGGYVVDPFRPFIQPGGFSSEHELRVDREFHFHAVREMLETLDIFVFTLGLTECWADVRDGAIFGACPGCGAGSHDPGRHRFVNLTVGEVVEDMRAFLAILARVNPDARVILTVSPVPLIATMEPRHVLTSTVLSKSVLRVAADVVQKEHANVSYFPSYEIVSAPFHGNAYYGDDRRNVSTAAVDHVMSVFFRHYAEEGDRAMNRLRRRRERQGEIARLKAAARPTAESFRTVSEELNRVICDEEMMEV